VGQGQERGLLPSKVVLVGLMGAGKTTVGKIVASRLGWDFFDSDRVVEQKTGVAIPVIFDLEGEAGFRRRESHALDGLLGLDRIVLATGGGIVLKPENRAVLRGAGLVAYIEVAPELLYARTRHDRNRPLLQVADPLARLRQLLAEREPFYLEVADVVIDGNRHNARQIAQIVEKEVALRCAR
jgi:shikimate kinase